MSDDWLDRAACVGLPPDLFFPDQGGSAEPARKVCRECSVQDECLEANMWERLGIYAGLTPKQRQRLRVERGLEKPPPPIDHGTPNGYRQHRKREERACPACLIAWSIYKGYEPRLRVVAEGAA